MRMQHSERGALEAGDKRMASSRRHLLQYRRQHLARAASRAVNPDLTLGRRPPAPRIHLSPRLRPPASRSWTPPCAIHLLLGK